MNTLYPLCITTIYRISYSIDRTTRNHAISEYRLLSLKLYKLVKRPTL